MAITSPAPPESALASARRDPDVRMVALIAVVALILAGLSHGHRIGGLPGLALASVGSLALFVVCGDALANALLPASWGVFIPLCSVALGAAVSGLLLTALGLAHVPLSLSLWLTLAAGVGASVIIRRRPGRRLPVIERRAVLTWSAVWLIMTAIALLPAWRTGADTIYGENPDAQQVAGAAVLFQHVPPMGTDIALPMDVIPSAWRFRYPIFYPLAGASNLTHMDPIRVFPAMAAVLVVISALGFALVAVRCLGAPERLAPAMTVAIGISWVLLYSAWHPYWNQLWGLAMFPWALLFGWQALRERDGRAAVLFVLAMVMLELSYPLAFPYPLVLFAVLIVGYGRRPHRPHLSGLRGWVVVVAVVAVLAPAVVAAALKLGTALGQILSAHSALWSGDVTRLMPIGRFFGTGGSWLPALAVVAVAAIALSGLPRRVAVAFGAAVLALLALDIRFRLARGGAYMDYKHLSFVGLLVLAMAVAAVARMVDSADRRHVRAGLAIAVAWTAAALYLDSHTVLITGEQVTPAQFQIRDWARRLPPGASIRIDIPPSGWQLWVVYMVGAHPVDSLTPQLYTTYAHARYGVRAQYSLAFRFIPTASGVRRPAAVPPFTQNPPLFENDQYVLRKIKWPARYAGTPRTASQRLVEP